MTHQDKFRKDAHKLLKNFGHNHQRARLLRQIQMHKFVGIPENFNQREIFVSVLFVVLQAPKRLLPYRSRLMEEVRHWQRNFSDAVALQVSRCEVGEVIQLIRRSPLPKAKRLN